MNRAERRFNEQADLRVSKKANKPTCMQKLPKYEQDMLERYIKEKTKEKLRSLTKEVAEKVVRETWAEMEAELIEAMRSHRISMDRIVKIFEVMNNSLSVKTNLDLCLDRDMQKYTTLNEEDFDTLISVLIENTCKGCTKNHKECEIYKILRKKAVPEVLEKQCCVYAYE